MFVNVWACYRRAMKKRKAFADRTRLIGLLEAYTPGGLTSYYENERGEVTRDVTWQRMESLRDRITELSLIIAAC